MYSAPLRHLAPLLPAPFGDVMAYVRAHGASCRWKTAISISPRRPGAGPKEQMSKGRNRYDDTCFLICIESDKRSRYTAKVLAAAATVDVSLVESGRIRPQASNEVFCGASGGILLFGSGVHITFFSIITKAGLTPKEWMDETIANADANGGLCFDGVKEFIWSFNLIFVVFFATDLFGAGWLQ